MMGGLSSRRGFLGLLPVAATAVIIPASAMAEPPAADVPMIISIMGDNMTPTLREGIHSLIAKPVAQFEGKGIYVFEDDGLTTVYRVYRHQLDGQLYARSDNPHYGEHRLTERWFNKHVVGKAKAAVRHFDRMGGMI